MFPVALWRGLRHYAAAIPHVAPAEELRIGVQDLFVIAGFRYAELVFLPHDGSEVTANQQEVCRIFRAPYEGDGRILHIMKIDPLKPRVVVIHFIESRTH